MKKSFLGKTWWIAGLLCAMPVMTVLPGCGGGSSVATPPTVGNQFAGFYIGTYLVTNEGPVQGQTGAFSVRIDEEGTIFFTSPGADNAIVGSLPADAALGTFEVELPAPNGQTFTVNGVLTRNANGGITGDGTFVSTDGTSGTITLNSVGGTQ